MKKSLFLLFLSSLISGVVFADPVAKLFLELKHQLQGPNLCVPTSASIILEYYGDLESPEHLKVLSKGDPTFLGTHYADLINGMRTLNYFWEMRVVKVDSLSFVQEVAFIEKELIDHHPPLVDVSTQPHTSPDAHGHTMVVVGFDKESHELIFMDPGTSENYIRRISFKRFEKIWHGARDEKERVTIFTRPKGEHFSMK